MDEKGDRFTYREMLRVGELVQLVRALEADNPSSIPGSHPGSTEPTPKSYSLTCRLTHKGIHTHTASQTPRSNIQKQLWILLLPMKHPIHAPISPAPFTYQVSHIFPFLILGQRSLLFVSHKPGLNHQCFPVSQLTSSPRSLASAQSNPSKH